MKEGLRQILIQYLKEKRGEWVHGGILEKLAQSRGYEGETAKRRLREFGQPNHHAYNPSVEQKIEKGCVMYRYFQETPSFGEVYKQPIDTFKDKWWRKEVKTKVRVEEIKQESLF